MTRTMAITIAGTNPRTLRQEEITEEIEVVLLGVEGMGK